MVDSVGIRTHVNRRSTLSGFQLFCEAITRPDLSPRAPFGSAGPALEIVTSILWLAKASPLSRVDSLFGIRQRST